MVKLLSFTFLAIAIWALPPAPAAADQWMTTADGCTYSYTKAPGYPAQWILVRNPTHINKPYGGEH